MNALIASAAILAAIVLPNEGTDAKPMTIRHHHVKVEIDNQVAHTTVQQTFENHTDSTLEGTFHFQLPPGAAVVDFAQWIGGERVGSEIEEKAEAKEKYEERKRAGERPALLEQLGDGTFTAKVSGVPANGIRRTELVYSQVLAYEGGTIGYRYPFDMKRFYEGDIDNVSFTVLVKDQKKVTSMSVDREGFETKKVTNGKWLSTLTGKNLEPDTDVNVAYSVESREMGINFLTFREPGKDGYFVLMIAPQELTTDKDIVKKDVVFVFDRSGSMSGHKIDQAREALKLSLAKMNKDDGFGVVGFSSGVDPFRNKILPASKTNIHEARGFVNNFRAGGGTNIYDGLNAAFSMLSRHKRPSAIVFLTDGQGNRPAQEVLSAVKQFNKRATRVFTFGVGNDVNRPFLEKLGANNRGDSQFLVDGVRIDDAVAKFYSSISQPVLADLNIDYGDVTSAMTYPASLPDVYKGQQVVIVGRYRGHGKTNLLLTGGVNGNVKKFNIPVEFPKVTKRYPFVPRIWAQRRIEHLLREMRMHGEKTEMVQEVKQLAKQFRIVTPYTSFVSKRIAPTVASLTPARIKPGDPEIWIDAPADAKRVTVHFPFGLTKKAAWDRRQQKWVVRFLIPKDTPDGVYFVRIAITTAAGKTSLATVNYTVDTKAPALDVALAANRIIPGAPLRLTARPAVTPLEVANSLDLKSLGISLESVKALVDVKTVTIVMEDGRRYDLDAQAGDAPGWHGVIETSPDVSPGMHTLTIYSVDLAGNVWGQRIEYEVVNTQLAQQGGN